MLQEGEVRERVRQDKMQSNKEGQRKEVRSEGDNTEGRRRERTERGGERCER